MIGSLQHRGYTHLLITCRGQVTVAATRLPGYIMKGFRREVTSRVVHLLLIFSHWKCPRANTLHALDKVEKEQDL